MSHHYITLNDLCIDIYNSLATLVTGYLSFAYLTIYLSIICVNQHLVQWTSLYVSPNPFEYNKSYILCQIKSLKLMTFTLDCFSLQTHYGNDRFNILFMKEDSCQMISRIKLIYFTEYKKFSNTHFNLNRIFKITIVFVRSVWE